MFGGFGFGESRCVVNYLLELLIGEREQSGQLRLRHDGVSVCWELEKSWCLGESCQKDASCWMWMSPTLPRDVSSGELIPLKGAKNGQ